MKEPRYVVVDERSFCGNSVFFWCWDGRGYTVDLRMAAIMTKAEAESITNGRSTDKMHKYADILKLVQHHVDMQDLRKIGERVFSHVYNHLSTNEDIGPTKLWVRPLKMASGKPFGSSTKFKRWFRDISHFRNANMGKKVLEWECKEFNLGFSGKEDLGD